MLPTTSLLCSVIIPAYNAERFLYQCVESVLKQTYPLIEIIIIDDGSSDTTWSIIQELTNQDSRIKGIRQTNQGVAEARNAGFLLAKGAYIALLDSDDIWLPDKLTYQISLLEKMGQI